VQLGPRYDGPAILRLDGAMGDPAAPLLRQRRRLADTVAGLDADQWAAPTRCEGWSVQDVVVHLTTTNQFWAVSITAGRNGAPTRLLAKFDPVATPAELVALERSKSSAEVLERFVGSNDDLAASIADLDDAGWAIPAEAPPGHLALRCVVLHALWDSWIHERDIMLPLGLSPPEEPDEILASLRYVAGLSPAIALARGSDRAGVLAVEVTDPDDGFVVEVGDPVVVRDGEAPADAVRLSGSAVDVLEALSVRAPLPQPLAEDDRWLLGDLAKVFGRSR
jgi:uncharacterized protein (TIGR03083 family)